MIKKSIIRVLAAALVLLSSASSALVIDFTIDGSDSIFMAGRTDLVIPPASDPWPGGMIRHIDPTPEEILETLPPITTLVIESIQLSLLWS